MGAFKKQHAEEMKAQSTSLAYVLICPNTHIKNMPYMLIFQSNFEQKPISKTIYKSLAQIALHRLKCEINDNKIVKEQFNQVL